MLLYFLILKIVRFSINTCHDLCEYSKLANFLQQSYMNVLIVIPTE